MRRMVEITEGATKLSVYKEYFGQPKGPKEKVAETVFYNPEMALGRDIGCGVLSQVVQKDWSVLDCLAGCGARGLRLAKEVPGNFEVTLNDHNPRALRLINRNIKANGLKNAAGVRKKAGAILGEGRFDHIDIDPFGTPAPFVHPALLSMRGRGVLALTATDTAVLCGAYPKTALRRYGARALKGTITHEAGMRILAAFVIREAAKLDFFAEPILAHATQHYMRLYMRIDTGSKKADNALAGLKEIGWNRKTQEFGVGVDGETVGPLYLGPLYDPKVLQGMMKPPFEPAMEKKYYQLVEKMSLEAKQPFGFYEVNKIAKALRSDPVKFDTLVKALEAKGYSWSPTHIMPNAFRTNAPYSEVVKAFRSSK